VAAAVTEGAKGALELKLLRVVQELPRLAAQLLRGMHLSEEEVEMVHPPLPCLGERVGVGTSARNGTDEQRVEHLTKGRERGVR
jgi:hypothetical protein